MLLVLCTPVRISLTLSMVTAVGPCKQKVETVGDRSRKNVEVLRGMRSGQLRINTYGSAARRRVEAFGGRGTVSPRSCLTHIRSYGRPWDSFAAGWPGYSAEKLSSPLLPSGLIMGSGGVCLHLEEAEIPGFAFVLDVGNPFPPTRTPGDSYVL